ncbi:P63C domain-containing protein [Olivibacter domesticus]|uniref:P63C domain-containing protein n=1 Tax=Olivibacter domesticus TaxID=407022 RepID=A0A1H7GNT0_OLID1|nr:P63C domain-containing protein [Olivibacter domesticus]SEK39714.1 P63C domain-containing protein [Olivibacter domesticus]
MAKQSKSLQNQEAPDKELKKVRDKDEQSLLLFNTEALISHRPDNVEEEIHQLQNGRQFTIKEVKDIISDMAREYSPMFPNSKPFFKLMYKLSGWNHLNPNDFIKPPVVATYIKKYIYARFKKDVLPILLAKDNPLVSGYVRKYKLFQFLNDEGLLLLEQYIQEAIDVMQDAKDWYDFELQYTAKYELSVQLKCLAN